MNLRPGSCALTLAVLCAAAQAHAQTPGRITRESVESHGGVSIGQAGKAAVSADGRFVAFQSDASDLVPGDTNQSTDIFVRERASGVLQRVSSTWNGMEARGDSMCPALSADGRYVAFASRAWNMYPGGANLGHSRWDVYVHDRQAGTTARVSLSPGPPSGTWLHGSPAAHSIEQFMQVHA
jgi:Tol biopolymer transport system component